MTTQTEALKRIAAYPFSRAEELSVEQMREIAREALAQPEQEPVAWRLLRKSRSSGEWVCASDAYWSDGVPPQELLDDVSKDAGIWRIEYAYTTPPQRKPLTDGQFMKIKASLSTRDPSWDGDAWDFALKEAIEEFHGIKE